MFTGLIEATGRIDRLDAVETGTRMHITAPFAGDLRAGDSVAVNGVCLTATDLDAEGFTVDISPATLGVTTLGGWRPGRLVNLERSLRADARLGGHFVLGHVDGVGRLQSLRVEGDYIWMDVEVPVILQGGLIPKGSIAIDGVSLTIASLAGATVGLQIVPFTRSHTALAEASAGDPVNVEVDVLGKYVARLLTMSAADRGSLPELS